MSEVINSIQFVREHIIANKEQIIKEVNNGQYVHYHRKFRDLPDSIQDEPNLKPATLDPIVKELLGFNNMSAFATGNGVERTDLMGYTINHFSEKSLSIVRLK